MWIVLLILSSSSQSCTKYNCHEGGYSIGPACAQVSSSGDIILQVCDDSSDAYCDTSGSINHGYNCSSIPQQNKELAYPGEPCSKNADCITNSCKANTCIGLGPGSYCTSNSVCEVGLFCGISYFCTQQLSLGMSCTSDFQCKNGLACNSTLFVEGTCILYFSIPSGFPTGNCVDLLTDGISNLCSSGACYLLNPGYDSIGVCEPAYYNLYEYPRICEEDNDCVGYNGVNTTIGDCACGLDMNGFAYCDAFNGDLPGAIVQSLLNIHVNNNLINLCHTQRRFDRFCLSLTLTSSQLQQYEQNRAEAGDTARYQGNDYCTKAIFNYNYYNISPSNFGCQAYGCGNLNNWNQGTCITFTEAVNSFALNPCDSNSDDSYCDYTISSVNKWNNVSCTNPPSIPLNYPGEPCLIGNDCISGFCNNLVCQGIKNGVFCKSSSECDVGLYCKSVNYVFTCQPLLQAYQNGCGSDYDCENYCGCVYTALGPPGTCIPYFSLAIGQPVQCSNTGISYLCQSGACFPSNNNIIGLCTYAPVSTSPIPASCTSSSSCTGQNSLQQTFQGTCTCGYNNNGASYCSVFVGDPPGVAYLNSLKRIFYHDGPVVNCQTTRRFSDACIKSTIVINQKLLFTNYPLYVNNDDCVKSIYTNDFWSTLPQLKPEETVSIY